MSRLIFSLRDTTGFIDSRCVTMATPQWMFEWFNSPLHQKIRGNGVPYTIYREDQEAPVYPQDSLFPIGVEGWVIIADEENMRDLVEEAWDSVALGKS